MHGSVGCTRRNEPAHGTHPPGGGGKAQKVAGVVAVAGAASTGPQLQKKVGACAEAVIRVLSGLIMFNPILEILSEDIRKQREGWRPGMLPPPQA